MPWILSNIISCRDRVFYRPQQSCGKVVFSEACVKNSVPREGVFVPACTTGHMTTEGGLCPEGGYLSGAVSVQGGLCRGGELCPRGEGGSVSSTVQ